MQGGENATIIAPGTLITLLGHDLADVTAAADMSQDHLPLDLGGVQLYCDGNRSPLLYVSPTQINGQMPFEFLDSNNISCYVRIQHNDGRVVATTAMVCASTNLDALLHPPPALPYEPGRVREYTLTATDREIEVAPGVFFPGLDVQRHGARAGAPRDRGRPAAGHTSSTPARIRTRSTSTASIRRTWTASSRSVPPGRQVHLRVRGEAVRDAALPLPRDAAEEAHPQGPLRRADHRPEGAAPRRRRSS